MFFPLFSLIGTYCYGRQVIEYIVQQTIIDFFSKHISRVLLMCV